MPHKDRDKRLAYSRGHHLVHRPSPLPVQQEAGLPPRGAVSYSEDGERIQCHVCGRWLGGLPSHISRAHDMTAAEYKEAYGLARGQSLWSPACAEKQRQAALARGLGDVGRKAVEEFGAPGPRPKGIANRLSSRVNESKVRKGKYRGRDKY